MTFSPISSENFKRHRVNLAVLAISISLASCGGGGSDGYFGNGGGSSGTGSNTNTGTTPVAAVNISNIQLLDLNSATTRTVTVAGATAKVKVTDATGKGISSAIVTFSGTGLIFGTSNGAVLTNADGEASISIKPASSTDTGSYQITATANYNSTTATSAAYNFALQAANIVIANMAAAATNLESGASTNITLKTQDATTNASQNNISVAFTTSCGTFDNAAVVSSNQGDITTTYKAIDANGKLCEGTQTITATGSTASTVKSIQVNIAAITANAIVYTTKTAVSLATKNSGSSSTGVIEFTVYSNGTPAANQDVSINLVRGPVDLTFITDGNRDVRSVKSDASGKVSVNLYPGALPGPVEIKATLVSNPNIFVLSKNVSVATGRVTQNGLSLSVTKNSLSGDKDGDTATITARMVDRVGNAVPDGTVISFVSEGGNITPNCATTAGICSVTLTTQNPRPSDNRVSVLAYVEGDKAYNDVNGDNLFTAGTDALSNNIGDFFRDDNENNQPDVGEFIYRRGATGSTCAVSNIDQPNITGTCDGGLDAVLRKQMLFAFASDTPTFVKLSGFGVRTVDNKRESVINKSSFDFQLYGNSAKTVPMPSGTTIAVSVKDNTDSTESKACEAEIVGGATPVPDVMSLLTPSSFALAANELVAYKVKTNKCDAGDEIRVTITASSTKTQFNFVYDPTAPNQ